MRKVLPLVAVRETGGCEAAYARSPRRSGRGTRLGLRAAARRSAISLGHLGLDTTTERVYQALLDHPDADLAEIRETVGLDHAATVAALDRLATLALVSWDDGLERPRLLNPDAALAALLAQHELEIADRRLKLEASRAAIDGLLAARHSEAAQSVDVERILGLDAVLRRIDDLSRRCQESVWSFNPGGPQSPENLRRSRPLNRETLQRGVRMRALYLESVRNDDATVEHVGWLTAEGAEVRVTPVLPLRMIIIDRAAVMVPIDDDDSAKGAILVTGRGMVTAMVALFTSTWRSAHPFGPRRSREQGDLNEQERQALRLWAQGRTDQAVAHALGVSERTVRRMSETISARLGARSRFEAGARAMEAGLLTSEDLV